MLLTYPTNNKEQQTVFDTVYYKLYIYLEALNHQLLDYAFIKKLLDILSTNNLKPKIIKLWKISVLRRHMMPSL